MAQCDGVVFKIVPMEGETLVNGERQKGAADMLAEVEIALALSALRGPLGASRHPCLACRTSAERHHPQV